MRLAQGFLHNHYWISMPTLRRRKAKTGIPFPKSLRKPKAAQLDESGQVVVRRRSRGIYLLPNAFTTAALFCGFYAIVMAMNLKFDYASIAIFVAMVLDSLDGRVDRKSVV